MPLLPLPLLSAPSLPPLRAVSALLRALIEVLSGELHRAFVFDSVLTSSLLAEIGPGLSRSLRLLVSGPLELEEVAPERFAITSTMAVERQSIVIAALTYPGGEEVGRTFELVRERDGPWRIDAIR